MQEMRAVVRWWVVGGCAHEGVVGHDRHLDPTKVGSRPVWLKG